MSRIYFDTSAYVKVYKRERGSSRAKTLIDLTSQNKKLKIIMSYWVINESIAVVDHARRKYRGISRKPEISEKQWQIVRATILKRIIEYSGSNIIFIPIIQEDVED
jgi:predicted nucleic acid-binding protein